MFAPFHLINTDTNIQQSTESMAPYSPVCKFPFSKACTDSWFKETEQILNNLPPTVKGVSRRAGYAHGNRAAYDSVSQNGLFTSHPITNEIQILAHGVNNNLHPLTVVLPSINRTLGMPDFD
jgi:hypothetical protein